MLKVYAMNVDGKRRAIVATTSWRKAAVAAGITVSRAYRYGSVTFNSFEVTLANSAPNVCFMRESDNAPFLSTAKN
jgi:hypothetical protein